MTVNRRRVQLGKCRSRIEISKRRFDHSARKAEFPITYLDLIVSELKGEQRSVGLNNLLDGLFNRKRRFSAGLNQVNQLNDESTLLLYGLPPRVTA